MYLLVHNTGTLGCDWRHLWKHQSGRSSSNDAVKLQLYHTAVNNYCRLRLQGNLL